VYPCNVQPFLQSLVSVLEAHPVNTNVFFRAFDAEYLSLEQLRAFLRQYHYFCKHFVKLLEGLLYKTPLEQVEMRIELVKTLHSELGNGHLAQAHITLLDRFAQALSLTPGDLDATIPLPEVRRYMELLHRLFIDSDYLTALGAETAVEITAASEFKYFYHGLMKYLFFKEDDLLFFKLHLQEEQCHGQWLLAAVEKTVRTPEGQARIQTAARETADAWHVFWRGLYREVFGRPDDAAA